MLRTDLIRPVAELLTSHAADIGARTAYDDGVRSVTYAELEARTRRLAGHFAQLWLQPGDRAAILLGNRVEAIEAQFAVTRAAGIGVPLDPRVGDTELAYLLADSGARFVVTDAAHAAQVARVHPAPDRLVLVVVGGEHVRVDTGKFVSFEARACTEADVPARDDLPLDAAAWMHYTSGTTGLPKGVLSSQRNCLWSVAACYVPIPGLTGDDRVLWPLPLFHSFAHITCVLAVTAVGATARITAGMTPDEMLDLVQDDGITFIAGVPAMYHRLVDAAARRDFHAPDLRIGLVGGAITTGSLRSAFEDCLGVPLLDAYGSTETCGSITINRPDGDRADGSCGPPVPGLSVRVVDRVTGRETAPGEEGEVLVSGPNVMIGYHNRPEVTSAVLRDGWYHTGDLARRDEAGHLTVSGRIKELVITEGRPIHPAEVEHVVRAAPGVADAAVVGRPHDLLGAVPVAFVVPRADGTRSAGADLGTVLAVCRERLPGFKVPHEVYEVASIPRTASGKISRHLLLDLPARRWVAGSCETLFRPDGTALVPARTTAAGRLRGPALVSGLGDPLIAAIAAHLVHAHRVRDLFLVVPPREMTGEVVELITTLSAAGARVIAAPADEDGLTETLRGLTVRSVVTDAEHADALADVVGGHVPFTVCTELPAPERIEKFVHARGLPTRVISWGDVPVRQALATFDAAQGAEESVLVAISAGRVQADCAIS